MLCPYRSVRCLVTELVDKGLVSSLLQPRHIHVLYAHRPASADEAGFEP